MEDSYFMVCQTCKTAEWIDEEDLHEYVGNHYGHMFRLMIPEVFEDRDRFRTWFLTFMDWPVEEAA